MLEPGRFVGGRHQKAVLYLEQAGDRAAELLAHEMALAHYVEAQEFAQRDGAAAVVMARLGAKRRQVLSALTHATE